MANSFVAVLMGADSDLPVMQSTFDTLDKLQIEWEAQITSVHRTPEVTQEYVTDAETRGCCVFIAAAGLAAHLAGAVSAHTIRPVIGVPLDTGLLGGQDALLATVQMSGGLPVATVSIGKAGATNAAYLAAQIMGINDAELSERLRTERVESAQAVHAKNRALQEKLTR